MVLDLVSLLALVSSIYEPSFSHQSHRLTQSILKPQCLEGKGLLKGVQSNVEAQVGIRD